MSEKIVHEPPQRLEFDAIDGHIIIGTNMCCQIHFDKRLLGIGVEVDISLELERIDSPHGVDYFVWLPVKDHTAPTQDQLDFGVASIAKFIEMDKKMYIHCQNGHGRAPTLVSAFYISQGLSVEAAIDFVKSKRPSMHLDDIQIEALREFAKTYSQ